MRRVTLFVLVVANSLAGETSTWAIDFTTPDYLSSTGPGLPPTDADLDQRAALVTDHLGTWVAVWAVRLPGIPPLQYDIVFSRSTDAGGTWTTASPIGAGGTADKKPSLATDGAGRWIAVWESDDDLGGPAGADGDILHSISADNAITWSPPQLLNSNGTTDGSSEDFRPSIATDSAGNWIALWSTNGILTSGQYEIAYARSTDGGVTWSVPALLSAAATSDVRSDFEPVLGTDGSGLWLAVFVGNQDYVLPNGTIHDALFTSRSMNNGSTWSAPQLLEYAGGQYVPEYYRPEIATDSQGNWMVMWNGEWTVDEDVGVDDMYYRRSTDNAQTWLATKNLTPPNPFGFAEGSATITTDGQGNWLAVWSANGLPNGSTSSEFDVVFSQSFNAGASWTTPRILNVNDSLTSAQYDNNITAAASSSGDFVVSWTRQSFSPNDFDLLVATATMAPPMPAGGLSQWMLLVIIIVALEIFRVFASGGSRER